MKAGKGWIQNYNPTHRFITRPLSAGRLYESLLKQVPTGSSAQPTANRSSQNRQHQSSSFTAPLFTEAQISDPAAEELSKRNHHDGCILKQPTEGYALPLHTYASTQGTQTHKFGPTWGGGIAILSPVPPAAGGGLPPS